MTTTPSVAAARQRQQNADTSLRLFKREVSLTIAFQPTPGQFVTQNPGFFQTVGNAIEITELRVQFEIKKNLGKEPNKCVLTVSNLSKETRTSIEQRKPIYAILAAGYDGVARHLFSGNVIFGESVRKGTDWETKMQVADGGRAFSHARMNHSYRKPVTVRQVLADAAASMGLKVPPEIEQSVELRQALATGLSARGPTRDVLTRILAPYGYGWSVQNGVLQILADDTTRADTAILINQDSGMIGTPEISVPNKPGAPSDMKFQNLLFPEIQAGGQVDMDAISVSGIYKVQDVEHKGDTHGKEWTTSCTCSALGKSSSKHRGRRH